MKNVILASVFALSTVAFAEGAATSTPAATPAAAAAPVEVKKVDKKTAKAECLKEHKGLKGAKLHDCIKGKQAM